MAQDQQPEESKSDGGWHPPSELKRKRLQQCFEHASRMMAQDNFDYATELLTQCVVGDPSNFPYLQAFLGNLKKKYNNNKKGSNMAFIKGAGLRRSVSKANSQKDWEGAIKSGVEALKLNPWDVATLTAMAEAVKQMGLDEVELVYLKTALEANSNDPDICRLCAIALKERKQYDQAIALWHRVEKARPGDDDAQRAIASLAVEKTIDKHEASEATRKPRGGQGGTSPSGFAELTPTQRLERELARKPDDIPKYIELADLYLQDELWDRAEALLTKAYEISQGDADVRERLEDTQLRKLRSEIISLDRQSKETQSEVDKARLKELKRQLNVKELEVFKNRCDRYPNNLVFKYDLGIRYQINGLYTEAIAEFQQAQRDPRRRGNCMLALGQCFQKIKQPVLAMRHYEQAIEEIPERDLDSKKLALYRAGRLSMAMNDLNAAERHLSQLAAYDFAYKDVAELLKRIADLRQEPADEDGKKSDEGDKPPTA